MSYVFRPDEWHGLEQFGSKGATLARLKRAGFNIPDWYVISAESFYASLTDEENTLIMHAESEGGAPKCDLSWQLSYGLHEDIVSATKQLCMNGERVAVRAAPELTPSLQGHERDLAESYYYIEPEQVSRALRAIWKSAFSERAQKIRMLAGLTPWPRAPAVIVQRMLDSTSSGGVFSADPVTGRRRVVRIRSTWGLGTALVMGATSPDEFEVSRDGKILTQTVVEKKTSHQCDHASEHGVIQVNVPPEKANAPSLTPKQVAEVASMARGVASFFGAPHRIEWAYEGDTLFLLDASPIEQNHGMMDPDAPIHHWSTRLLEDVFMGEISPASFGLLRGGFRTMGKGMLDVFRYRFPQSGGNLREQVEMVGWHHGEVRFHETRLQRLAAMLPAYQNRPQKVAAALQLKALPQDDEVESHKVGMFRSWWEGRKFQERFDQWIAKPSKPKKSRNHHLNLAIGEMAPEELMEAWRRVRRQYEAHLIPWLPLNLKCDSLFAELHSLTRSEMADGSGQLATELLAGCAVPDDAKAALELAALGAEHHGDESLSMTLQNGSLVEIEFEVAQRPAFEERFRAILGKYPCVQIGAHMLTAVPLGEAPLVAYRAVGRVSSGLAFPFQGQPESPSERLSRVARETVSEQAKDGGKAIFAKANEVRAAMEAREDHLRQWAVFASICYRHWSELGRELTAAGVISSREDLLEITPGELERFWEACSPHAALSQIVDARKVRSRLDRSQMRVPMESQTHGELNALDQIDVTPKCLVEGKVILSGKSWSNGSMKGRVAVAIQPENVIYRRGDLLAMPAGGVGWALVAVGSAGLLTEGSSAMGHMVRVARELSIPVVGQLDGLTAWLRDGDHIEVNCNLGEVRKVGGRVFR